MRNTTEIELRQEVIHRGYPALTIRGTGCILTVKKGEERGFWEKRMGLFEHRAFQWLAFDESGAAASWAWVRVAISNKVVFS